MSIVNISINLSSYSSNGSGCNVTNNPQQLNFRWNRSISNITSDNVLSQSLIVPVSSSVTLFTGAAVHKFLFLETNSQLTLLINGTITVVVKPFVNGTIVSPGVFMVNSDITSLVVTNASSTAEADVFFTAIE